MTFTLGDRCVSGVTLGGSGGDGIGGELSMGKSLWSSNGAAAIGGAIVGVWTAVATTGWLRPLRRKDWESCGAADTAVGRDEVCGAIRGGMVAGGRCIGGDGTLGAVVFVSNISASWRSASSCGLETGANGDAGYGCRSVAVRSLADSIAASTEDVVGMDER